MIRLTLLLYLFTAVTPLPWREELHKLPGLVAHFQEHNAENSDLDFWGFLSLHYGNDFRGHKHAHDHSDLPGKSGHDHSYLCFSHWITPPEPTAPWIFTPSPEEDGNRNFAYDFRLPLDANGNIWQPPKA